MARLSVNLNKIALLRNARRTGVPDVLRFGRLARDAGAQGLTVHPRPDERHIRRSDVPALADLVAPWRPGFEFNIEGYPDEAFLRLVADVRPDQCTLVPDAPDTFTSDEGWRLDGDRAGLVRDAVARLKGWGCRAVVFIDPDPDAAERAAALGADGIEIYTGGYGAAFARGDHGALLERCAAAAGRAAALGLVVNVGHDLNLDNLPPLVAALPALHEASIGHELTADALEMGWTAAVAAYRNALAGT
ncbi:pyridoxine 5'-phosphate synthase [Lichenibacterium minor]